MQPSLQRSVSPKSVSGSIWAKGDVQLQHMSSQKTVLKLAAKKGEHGVWSLQKSISATIRALNLIVFTSLLFLHPITLLSLCSICPASWDFSFAATTFVVCWAEPQLKAHPEPCNHWGFYLKAKGKKSYHGYYSHSASSATSRHEFWRLFGYVCTKCMLPYYSVM